jgi:hypothetical protein
MWPIPKWLSEEIDEAQRAFSVTRRSRRHVVAWLYNYGQDLTSLPESELHRLILDANDDAASPLSDELARSYGI